MTLQPDIGSMQHHDLPEIIEFIRPMKYRAIRVLGSGACGQTVLIRDEQMGVNLVAKKYHPTLSAKSNPTLFTELLDRFREEARILFQLNHPNIVRVFNYYDYREANTSYIIMEHVSGVDILNYIKDNPMNADRVFEKVVDGFTHLERKQILHRDIRPLNILVTDEGDPKIIDFGFGKQIDFELQQSKSISLNWWCEPPPEFEDSVYDLQTEVYFIGKLFEVAVRNASLSDFKYLDLVRMMSDAMRSRRFRSFSDIQRTIAEGKFAELKFSDNEIEIYRNFADGLSSLFSKIGLDSTYRSEPQELLDQLEALYRSTMLEKYIPSPSKLGQAVVKGSFHYWKEVNIEVSALSDFLKMMKGLSSEKRGVVIANLFSRLDEIARYFPPDDEIPF